MTDDAFTTDTLRAAAVDVLTAAHDMGFAMVGVAPAQASEHADWVQHWLDQGQHGEMDYLANYVGKRLDPREVMPGAQSVIVVADRYAAQPPEGTDVSAPGYGRLARYAWGDDYHKVMKKRLFVLADLLQVRFANAETKVTVDTAPTLEREHAKRAGLGWVGKHTLIIHPQLGSYLLLGTIVTTLPLVDAWREVIGNDTTAPDSRDQAWSRTHAHLGPKDQGSTLATLPGLMPDHCGTCTRCIEACPTDCITPYRVDAQRCISYLTLEHRGSIDASLHTAMGDWIGGCDICQEVCPHNRPRDAAATDQLPAVHERFTPRPPAPKLRLLALLDWSAEDRQQAFQGSALKRMKLEQVRRNAVIAAGNALCGGSAGEDVFELRVRIHAIAKDANEHPIVRDAAQAVVRRLADEAHDG